MRADMIRCAHGRKNERNKERNPPNLVLFDNQYQPEQVSLFFFEILVIFSKQ
jgi:hypothetical protein